MKIRSLVEYLNAVEEKKVIFSRILHDKDFNTPLFWFRGESKSNYKLIPTIYREVWRQATDNDRNRSLNIKSFEKTFYDPSTIIRYEKQADYEFQKDVFNLLPDFRFNDNPWIRYYLKQHYGWPTRLLDWTESSLIGLFFAVNENSNCNGKVWLLNPGILNYHSLQSFGFTSDEVLLPAFHNNELTFPKTLKKPDFKNYEESKSEFYKDIGRLYYYFTFLNYEAFPLSIESIHVDRRISNQKSCFTIHGNKMDGFDMKNKNLFLDSIIIDRNSKDKIRAELVETGIGYSYLFPDLQHLGKDVTHSLRNKYSFIQSLRIYSDLK